MGGLGALVTFSILIATFPYATVAVFNGPDDTTVLQGTRATLACSNSEYTVGIDSWNEGDDAAFASQDGIFPGATFAKYQDFEIISSDITQMDLVIPDAQPADEGSYTCELTPAKGTAVFKVEIRGAEPIIRIDGDSSGNPIILRESVQSVLRCTATGYRPAVNLQWYKDNIPITAGVGEDAPTADGDTSETSGTLTFTPTIEDNEDILECRTTGQSVVSSQTGSLTLNVQYVPVVTVEYSGGRITCSVDANPFATSSQIILNGTQILETFTTNGQSVDYEPTSCTYISCNATNTVETGTGTYIGNPVCPVIPEETTTEMPSTGHVDPTTPRATKPPTTKTTGQPVVGLSPGAIAAIAVCCVILILGVVIVIIVCYKQKKCCFETNKSGSGGSSSPKKQPSVANADMIRNQTDVRQSVHKYDDEPKKPRVPRSSTGNAAAGKQPSGKQPSSPEKEALKQTAPRDVNNDHRGYPMDSYDGENEQGGGQGGVNYADLEFQNRQGETNGHGNVHQPPSEEPTQYASILV